MSKKSREWIAFSFSSENEDTSHIIVDNRLKPQTKYDYFTRENKVKERSMLSFKWTPAIVIHVSEAYPPEEAANLARILCNALNANWVKEELGGG